MKKDLEDRSVIKGSKSVLVVNIIVLVFLVGGLVYSLVRIFADEREMFVQHFVSIVQNLLGITLIFLPSILKKSLKLQIPSFMQIALVVFIYLAMFLGEARSFYYRFHWWDSMLHFISGAGFALLSFSLINILNNNDKLHVNLSPGFVALFAFCFALSVGAIWEIMEFVFDEAMGFNAQKFLPEEFWLSTGQNSNNPLGVTDEEIALFYRYPSGYRFALMDTMKDIIIDCAGALIMSIAGYFLVKFRSDAWDKLVIVRERSVPHASITLEESYQGEQHNDRQG